VAEGGARAAGEHRRPRAGNRGAWHVADGVDTGMDPDQASGAEAMGDATLAESERAELRARDVTVLPGSQRREVGFEFSPHPKRDE
jgi:hypothetical protein